MEIQNITNNNQKITAFYSIYKKYFPTSERETLANMKKLAKASSTVSNWDYTILELTNEENSIAGGVVYDWFSDINVIVIEYIFTLEAFRHKKIARNLVYFIKQKTPNAIVLIEVEKNGLSKPFWEKLGFFVISEDYIQPPISKKEKSFDGLVIMSNTVIKNLDHILKNYYWKYSFLN